MAQTNTSLEYVINPATGRVIRKKGKAYRKWRRAHPDAVSPRTLSTDAIVCKQMGTQNKPHAEPRTPAVSRDVSPSNMDRIKAEPQSTPPRLPSVSRSTVSVQPHEPQSAPPPLRRCNAMARGDLPHLLDFSKPLLRSGVGDKEPSDMEHEDDTDVVTDQVLCDYGPQLLRAYEDPEVDFLETLAHAFGLHGAS